MPDFVQDLTDKTISQLAESYLWPSILFWSAIFLAYETLLSQFCFIPNCLTVNNSIEIVHIVVLGLIVLVTAYLLRLVNPSVYRLLQGRLFWRVAYLHNRQKKRLLRLQQNDREMAQSQVRLESLREVLLRPVIMEGVTDDEVSETVIENLVSELMSLETTTMVDPKAVITPSFVSKLKNCAQTVEGLASDRGTAYDDINEIKERVANIYHKTLDEIDRSAALIEWDRSNNVQRLLTHYPPNSSWVAPTAFGNRWAAIEAYSYTRYGVPLVVLWPRLYVLLSEQIQSELRSALAQIDASVSLWMLSSIYLLFLLPTIIFTQSFKDPFAIILPIGAMVGVVLFYSLTLTTTVSYGKLVMSLVDLKRRRVLEEMSLELPSSIPAEKELWEKLGLFIAINEENPILQLANQK